MAPEDLRSQPFDVVVLQRPHELDLVRRWTGRRPGIDLPAVYLEHNTPEASPCRQRHPLADRRDIPIAHVTHFNRLYWDNGEAPTTVIEHGIIDPGARYTGELRRGAVVVNEPGRRGRMVGADLVTGFADIGPVDVYGMQTQAFVDTLPTDAVVAHENLRTQEDMHAELARRRVYLHPMRWTSLGLSLIEAMQLGHADRRRGGHRGGRSGAGGRRGGQHGPPAAARGVPHLPARARRRPSGRCGRSGRGAGTVRAGALPPGVG